MNELPALYDSEINFTILTVWDAGFKWKLGHESNGFVAKANNERRGCGSCLCRNTGISKIRLCKVGVTLTRVGSVFSATKRILQGRGCFDHDKGEGRRIEVTMKTTKFVVKVNRGGTLATQYVQRIDRTPIQTTTNRKLALIMGRFTAEDAAKSIQTSRCTPELVSVQTA